MDIALVDEVMKLSNGVIFEYAFYIYGVLRTVGKGLRMSMKKSTAYRKTRLKGISACGEC